MAAYKITSENAGYLTIEVTIQDSVFQQTIICTLKNEAEKTAFLQNYAESYESAWLELERQE